MVESLIALNRYLHESEFPAEIFTVPFQTGPRKMEVFLMNEDLPIQKKIKQNPSFIVSSHSTIQNNHSLNE